MLLKTEYNEAKRLTEFSKGKAKECLNEAQRLSGVMNPNDITPEKQQVQYDHTINCVFLSHSTVAVR